MTSSTAANGGAAGPSTKGSGARDALGRRLRPRRHSWGGGRGGRTHWTRERIRYKIIQWTDRYGEPPTYEDWAPSNAARRGRQDRVKRFYEGDWPQAATVYRAFGSFRAALIESGCDPTIVGDRQGPTVPIEVIRSRVSEPCGPAQLAHSIRAVARARKETDLHLLAGELDDLAVVAASYARAVRQTLIADAVDL